MDKLAIYIKKLLHEAAGMNNLQVMPDLVTSHARPDRASYTEQIPGQAGKDRRSSREGQTVKTGRTDGQDGKDRKVKTGRTERSPGRTERSSREGQNGQAGKDRKVTGKDRTVKPGISWTEKSNGASIVQSASAIGWCICQLGARHYL